MHMCNADTILDSGATQSMCPLNYPHLNQFIRYSQTTVAKMANQKSTLQLYGTAKYGTFEEIVADVHRPLLSEEAITGPPYNLQVIKSGPPMYEGGR